MTAQISKLFRGPLTLGLTLLMLSCGSTPDARARKSMSDRSTAAPGASARTVTTGWSAPRRKRMSWRLDRQQSFVRFTQQARVVNVEGKFGKFRLGSIQMKSDKPESLRGVLLIETASVNTKNSKRDAHLRADDFFWSKKYRYAIVRVTDVEEDEGEFEVTFLLKIRDKVREYTIPLELAVKPRTIIASARLYIRREHFDLTGNYAQNVIMQKDALISFRLVLRRK